MKILNAVFILTLSIMLSACNFESSEEKDAVDTAKYPLTINHTMLAFKKGSLNRSSRALVTENNSFAQSSFAQTRSFSSVPFSLEGTSPVLVSTASGPFDLAGKNVAFNVDVTDAEGLLTRYYVNVTAAPFPDPSIVTQSQLAAELQLLLAGSPVTVTSSPLTLATAGLNGGTLTLVPDSGVGITLSDFGFEEANRTNTGIADRDSADFVLNGSLVAAPTNALTPAETFDWSIYLDDETFVVQSNTTVYLSPNEYDFTLSLSDELGQRLYVGTARATVLEGENDIDMVIEPFIGNMDFSATVVDHNLLSSLTRFQVDYDLVSLVGHGTLTLGISINGQPEVIFNQNEISQPVGTGFYLELLSGPQQIELSLYSDGQLIARSLDEQENQVVVAGQSIDMDIVPLTGTTLLSLSEQGGDASVRFPVPAEVLDQVQYLESNLVGLFSLQGTTNSILDAPFSVVAGVGEFTVPNVQFGTARLTIRFMEADTGDIVASCESDIVVSTTAQALMCNLSVRQPMLVQGDLLASVGLTVLTNEGEPVQGAVVTDNQGNVLGLTGSALFGTPGFIGLNLPAGFHALTVTSSGSAFGELSGSASLSLVPLQVFNQTIRLNPLP